MTDIQLWIGQHFLWLFLGGVVWTVANLSLNALARRRRGEPVFRPDVPGAVFTETWTSAGMSPVAWGHNCVWVAVTSTELHVGLHFPFSIAFPKWATMFRPPDLRIPLSSIRATEDRHGFRLGRALEVTYHDGGGGHGSVLLKLRDETRFLERLNAGRGRTAMPRSGSA